MKLKLHVYRNDYNVKRMINEILLFFIFRFGSYGAGYGGGRGGYGSGYGGGFGGGFGMPRPSRGGFNRGR